MFSEAHGAAWWSVFETRLHKLLQVACADIRMLTPIVLVCAHFIIRQAFFSIFSTFSFSLFLSFVLSRGFHAHAAANCELLVLLVEAAAASMATNWRPQGNQATHRVLCVLCEAGTQPRASLPKAWALRSTRSIGNAAHTHTHTKSRCLRKARTGKGVRARKFFALQAL